MEGKSRIELYHDQMFQTRSEHTVELYKPRKGDIIIVGPPKSGTTWMQQIIHQIRTKCDETFNDIYNVTWYIWHPNEQGNLDVNGEQVCNPRVYKHHESFGVIETTLEQKHVVIVRNPYDAAYSWVKFMSRWYGDDLDYSDEEAATHLQERNTENVSPSMKCISTWWKHRNDPNVLFLFYEDLQKDLEAAISKVATFIEIPLSEEELKRITYLSSFEYMSKHKEKFQGDVVIDLMASARNLAKWTPKMGMVRADGGKVGQGTQSIGPKLSAMVDKLWKEDIEELYGYKTYHDMYNSNSLFKSEN